MKMLILGCVMICMTMGCSARQGASNSAAFVGTVLDSMIGSHGTYADNQRYWDNKMGVHTLPPRDSVVMTGVTESEEVKD